MSPDAYTADGNFMTDQQYPKTGAIITFFSDITDTFVRVVATGHAIRDPFTDNSWAIGRHPEDGLVLVDVSTIVDTTPWTLPSCDWAPCQTWGKGR
ncbi:hypothetical protein ACFQ1S_06700 [Kibdelosporangium lantanae]|uniref:Uncharacterized protein n=1 Tax=Kibdelosporangium lantanae TaxID=1497396 RepID=A0ABW3M7H8_9PSEU